MDIDNILVTNKISSGEKNYNALLDSDYKIKPLFLMLPKTSTYVTGYDGETKWMYFSMEDGDLLNKYNNIWNKVSNSIKKELESESI